MRLVVVESPYAGKASKWWGPLAPVVRWWNTRRNVAYARAAMRYCLMRGWAPIASHLLYTQPDVLRDWIPEERRCGIFAGFAWGRHAEARCFFIDLGWTPGMHAGVTEAKRLKQRVEEHTLPNWYGVWIVEHVIAAVAFLAIGTLGGATLRAIFRWIGV